MRQHWRLYELSNGLKNQKLLENSHVRERVSINILMAIFFFSIHPISVTPITFYLLLGRILRTTKPSYCSLPGPWVLMNFKRSLSFMLLSDNHVFIKFLKYATCLHFTVDKRKYIIPVGVKLLLVNKMLNQIHTKPAKKCLWFQTKSFFHYIKLLPNFFRVAPTEIFVR